MYRSPEQHVSGTLGGSGSTAAATRRLRPYCRLQTTIRSPPQGFSPGPSASHLTPANVLPLPSAWLIVDGSALASSTTRASASLLAPLSSPFYSYFWRLVPQVAASCRSLPPPGVRVLPWCAWCLVACRAAWHAPDPRPFVSSGFPSLAYIEFEWFISYLGRSKPALFRSIPSPRSPRLRAVFIEPYISIVVSLRDTDSISRPAELSTHSFKLRAVAFERLGP